MLGHAALILGAGFSKSHDGPLMRDLLAPRYIEKGAGNQDALRAISVLRQERQSSTDEDYTVENLFTDIWRRSPTGGTFTVQDHTWDASNLLSELTRHLASVCELIRLDMRTHDSPAYVECFEG